MQQKPNNIIPYCMVNGAYTVLDNQSALFYEDLEKNNLVKTLFYDGTVRNVDQFIEFIRRPIHTLNFVIHEEKIVGVSWINGFEYRTAWAHFCTLPELWAGKAVDIGKEIIKYWFNFERDGVPVLNTIYGRIPEDNHPALIYTKKLGFKQAGKLPNMCHYAETGRTVDAVLIYCERGES